MARTFIIGDVHGCLAELETLFGQINPQPLDHIVWVGDLVDKGPDPAGVVRFARGMARFIRTTFIQGNHEERHFRYRRCLSEGRECVMKRQDELKALHAALSPEDVAFLDTAVPFRRLSEHRVLVVHGGVPPMVQTLSVKSEPWAAMTPQERKPLAQLLRTRFVNVATGDMVPLGKQRPGLDPWWADVYDGRFGFVLHGHEACLGDLTPLRWPHAMNLDMGCVYGGHLAAAILDDARPGQIETVQVKALQAWVDHRDDEEG